MSAVAESQTLKFDAEVKQLLRLFAKSLYSNRDVFLRELTSNASDALDKLRYEALADKGLYESDSDLKIWVDFNKEKRFITIRDNGIGMNREELVTNLGTIAHSGTRAYLDKLSQSSDEYDSQMIGQFGVGFYSSFVVADKVTVKTRRAGESSNQGWCWESDGEGAYTLTALSDVKRGTEITLHLKSAADEYLNDSRLREIITRYSDHIAVPIVMFEEVEVKSSEEDKNDEKDEHSDDEKKPVQLKRQEVIVNQAKALWSQPKKDITKEQYETFYKHISHDFQNPLLWVHNQVEGSTDYTSLLYIPSQAPFDFMQHDARKGLKLYVQRVFIMDDADQFLPAYLRFVKGIIDCKDLPLNVSREILQGNKVVSKIKSASTQRVLKELEGLADKNPEQYALFWKAFGVVLKEGPGEDFSNKVRIAKLLRFASTYKNDETQSVSLSDYVSRMKEKQKEIYYLIADNFNAAKNSPHLEAFKEKDIEVLILFDRVDEWLMAHLQNFEDHPLKSVAKGSVVLDDFDEVADESEGKKEDGKKPNAEILSESFIKQMKEVLKDKVKDVRATQRLTSSPACLVTEEQDMSNNLQRMLKEAGQSVPTVKPILELNPNHVMVDKLKNEQSDSLFSEWSHLLFDLALLSEGGHLDDSAGFVKRINKLLT